MVENYLWNHQTHDDNHFIVVIKSHISQFITTGWWFEPSWKSNISQWEGLSHILWKMKNVWTHQPDHHIPFNDSHLDPHPLSYCSQCSGGVLRKLAQQGPQTAQGLKVFLRTPKPAVTNRLRPPSAKPSTVWRRAACAARPDATGFDLLSLNSRASGDKSPSSAIRETLHRPGGLLIDHC